MSTLTYHLSEKLQETIKSIDETRTKVLTTPIPPKLDLRLRWEANLEKTFFALSLAENPMTKLDMAKLLMSTKVKQLTNYQKDVISYRKALDFVRAEWTGSDKEILAPTLLALYTIAGKPVYGGSENEFRAKRSAVEKVLAYLSTGSDHPVIKAGIIQIQIIKISPFSNVNSRIARLASQLYLYKYGYDARELLVLEEYYRNDLVALQDAIASPERTMDLTHWLEYFANGVALQMSKALETIKETKLKTPLPASNWKLNERQKEVLNRLENPDIKVTNKDVQKMFGVSQITASRDLAKLLKLNLLLARGRGRSTSYTKV